MTFRRTIRRWTGRALAGTTLLVIVGWCATSRAHWEEPDAIVADLNTDTTRRTVGVEQAIRDPNAPRLLVIRVGERWNELPEPTRIAQATAWLERWRHNVAQGIVAILDARSDRPVIRFGPGGTVAAVHASASP
jgi:hypothetical protein